MSLPYENATSGDKAVGDMQKILQAFGCNKFGVMQDFDTKELIVQFEWNKRQVTLKASWQGYAAAWLKHHPYSSRTKGSRADHEAKAMKIGGIAVYSIVRDWLKGQVTAIEIGMMDFEGAFLSHLLLPNGVTVREHVNTQKLLQQEKQST